jgi:hypothetical protein
VEGFTGTPLTLSAVLRFFAVSGDYFRNTRDAVLLRIREFLISWRDAQQFQIRKNQSASRVPGCGMVPKVQNSIVA